MEETLASSRAAIPSSKISASTSRPDRFLLDFPDLRDLLDLLDVLLKLGPEISEPNARSASNEDELEEEISPETRFLTRRFFRWLADGAVKKYLNPLRPDLRRPLTWSRSGDGDFRRREDISDTADTDPMAAASAASLRPEDRQLRQDGDLDREREDRREAL